MAREVLEGMRTQGPNEQIAYSVTTTAWGSSPSSVACYLYDVTDQSTDVSVTSTKLSGSVSTGGDVITTPKVISLVLGHMYRLDVRFTSGGNVYEAIVRIKCE